jgi:uncharacterized membrane protein YkvA (DUF1232 family)
MKQGSLFDNEPSVRFQKIIKEYGEIYTNPEILRQSIEKHMIIIMAETSQNEFINVSLAEKIKDICLLLIEEFNDKTLEEKRYISATVNYFISKDDEEEDLFSPLGFDDDAEILNECLKLIGKESLTIDIW